MVAPVAAAASDATEPAASEALHTAAAVAAPTAAAAAAVGGQPADPESLLFRMVRKWFVKKTSTSSRLKLRLFTGFVSEHSVVNDTSQCAPALVFEP